MRNTKPVKCGKLPVALRRTQQRRERAFGMLEALESRTLMSVAPHAAPVISALAAPASLVIKSETPKSVVLSWTDKDANAAGYFVLRSTDGVNFTQIAQINSAKANSYTDSTVSSDTAYSYKIQAFYQSVVSGVSNAAAGTTPLIAPSGLTGAGVSGTDANLNWTINDPSTTGSYVLRATDGKHFSIIATLGAGVATYDDLTVVSGRTYQYEVESTNGSVISAATGTVTVNTPLAAPSNLGTTVNGPTSVSLSWTDNDPDAGGYYILRSTDAVKYTQIAKLTGAAVAAYTDGTAASFHNYFYEVEAYYGTIVSPASGAATASTPMAVPTGLAAKATSPTAVALTWTDKEPGATAYNILRSTDDVNFSVIATVNGVKAASFTDTTASSDTTYYYQVQAANVAANTTSVVSNTATTTTPLIAANQVVATAVSGTDINLTWADNDPNTAGNYILRSTDGKHFSVIATLDVSQATYDDLTVTSGHSYSYAVQAFNGGVTATPSNPVAVNTPLAAPSNLGTTVNGPTSISLSWTDNDPDAAGYYVLRGTDGTHFTQIAKVNGAAVAAYTDTTALSFHNYYYEVEAFNGTIVSPADATGSAASTPLAPATGLTAKATSPTAVALAWTDKDPAAAGYNILQSTDGVNFTVIAQVAGAKASSYTDTTVGSDAVYFYEVQAYNGNSTSTVSNKASTVTPLIAPSGLVGTAVSGTDIQLTWTDNDPNAGGYNLLRSTDGKHFSSIGVLTAGSTSYDDTTVVSGRTYMYMAQAVNGNVTSAMTRTVTVSTPLAAPSGLNAAANGPTSVGLTWTDNDPDAAGYEVFRSTNGVNFSLLAKVNGASASAYTDTTATSGHALEYEVEAMAGTIFSAASGAASVTTPLVAPASLAAKAVGSLVNLTWTDKDKSATGYLIFSSTDGVNFNQIAALTSATASSYTDGTVTAGQTYYYEVQATNAITTSAVTAPVSVAVPQGNSNAVTITTRYTNELVITASGAGDSVTISQNGNTVSVFADGQTYSEAAPADGLFVYTRGGTDFVTVNSNVTVATTIDTIDNASTTVTNNDATAQVWVDANDTFTGDGVVHKVASFAGGVSKTLGASLANPSDAGATTKANDSLFGAGPVAADENQGEVGDCYFLSSLAAFAGENPTVLRSAAVDLGDGTYAVQFYNNGTPEYVRVNNSFSTGPFNGFEFANPGANKTIWAMVMEKAFAYFRTGANTYNSINSGWMGEVYSDLGVNSQDITPSSDTQTAFYNQLSTALASGEAVTFGTPSNAPNLVGDHAYTLISVSKDGSGVTHYTVRNPWGVSGDSLENSQGYATLTFAQMQANFDGGVVAVS